MKHTYKLSLVILLFSFVILSAQQGKNWKEMNINEKKAELKNMSSDQKMKLLQSFKQNLMVEELEIPDINKEEFSALYTEYQSSQKSIKSKFQHRKDFEDLTDEEAILELDTSFEVGQKLLDNKREYSKKFQRIMKPQQVLELFENEGKMRAKVRERNQEVQSRRTTPTFRNSTSGNVENTRKNSSQRRR